MAIDIKVPWLGNRSRKVALRGGSRKTAISLRLDEPIFELESNTNRQALREATWDGEGVSFALLPEMLKRLSCAWFDSRTMRRRTAFSSPANPHGVPWLPA